MDQIVLLDRAERYLRGEMTPEERFAFEELRKEKQEVDQFVVEHHLFAANLETYAEMERFKANLYDVHHTLKETGELAEVKPAETGRLVAFWSKYRRTIAVAASIAGITALLTSTVTLIFSPKTPIRDIEELRRKVNTLEVRTNTQDRQIKAVNQKIDPNAAVTFGGTSFLIDPKGYLVTSAHVVDNARQVFVQNKDGQDLKTELVFIDKTRDLAVLKIKDEDFIAPSSLPYGFRKAVSDLAEPVFTLGYPKDEIVYGEGYLSALTGLKGDTLASQIAISANPGNSGGPVINRNGEIIGILNARQTQAVGVVFAITSRQLIRSIEEHKEKDSSLNIKLPTRSTIRGIDRIQQVKKIDDYIYMVKVIG
jgi:S1-C subfamily serine protease